MYVDKLTELNLLTIMNQCRDRAYEIRCFHKKHQNQLGKDEVVFHDAVCQLSTLNRVEEQLARSYEKLPVDEAEGIMVSLVAISAGFAHVSKLKYQFYIENEHT